MLRVLLLAGIALWAMAPAPAGAQCALSPAAALRLARELLDDASRDPEGETALPDLQLAYRLSLAPLLLYNQALILQRQGQPVAAADLLRRYLREAGAEVPPQRQEEIRRTLAALPQDSGELVVLGRAGALVSVEDRLLGVLPLSAPILLPAGSHRVRLEHGGRAAETRVTVVAGQTQTVDLHLSPTEPEGMGGPAGRRDDCAAQPAEAYALARRLLLRADERQQKGDLTQAARDLEVAYQIQPAPLLLYNLGLLWAAQGRTEDAADVLRRYQAAAGLPAPAAPPASSAPQDADAAARRAAEVDRALRRVNPAMSGDLHVDGETGALLRVDGRLAGRLPLPAPLLLSAGPHRLLLQSAYRAAEKKVQVRAGGTATVELDLPAAALVLPLPADAAVPADLRAPLVQALEEAAARAGLVLVPGRDLDLVGRRVPWLRRCLAPEPCPEVPALFGARYVLAPQVRRKDAGDRLVWEVGASLLDAAGTVTMESRPCPAEDGAAAARLLADLGGQLLTREPPPAPHQPPSPAPRPRRPTWRLALGGVLAGGGLLGAAFGGSALGVNGRCEIGALACLRSYDTLGVGVGLVAGGAALTAVGAALLLWPAGARR